MGDDIMEVLTKPTVDVALAGRVLGIGKNAAYRAREAGDIPSIKIGGQYRVPTAKLREMLGLPPSPPQAPLAA
ncbi:helix-turn-helix domain-containing protein [Methylobacterium sp. A54F]